MSGKRTAGNRSQNIVVVGCGDLVAGRND